MSLIHDPANRSLWLIESFVRLVYVNILFPHDRNTFSPSPGSNMKIIPGVTFIFLLLLVTAPNESEGAIKIIWFIKIAKKLGIKLAKNSYYARCNVRNVPAGINCPGVAFGVGLSRNQAQNAARAYARTFGDQECGRYVGHCQIYKFRGK